MKKINYDKIKSVRHPLCKGIVYQTLDGNEYDCGYNSEVTCDQCRFLLANRGRGKDPRAKVNNSQ